MNTKENIFRSLEMEVLSTNKPQDTEYFKFHKKRFERLYDFVVSHNPSGKKLRVLELGSHYLHTSYIINALGHELHGVDVSEFWELDFVKARSKKLGIHEISENDLANFHALDAIEGEYDLILFTEIMEHITFNPVNFWKKIHHKTANGGLIYISTPNSFNLPNIVRSIKNMVTFNSIGISAEDILDKVTYGHHWKEYSAKEVKRYFQMLSDDFEVEIHKYHYKEFEMKGPFLMFKILSKIGNFTGFLSEELEIIVRVKKNHGWKKELPKY